MIINGVELECDVLDVTTLKAIKQGSERVANIEKEIAPIQDEIEQIEAISTGYALEADELEKTARYQIQCKLTYYKER